MSDAKNSPGDLRYWTQSIDGTLYGCWYRLRTDGQIEVFARGHRVTLPLDAIALLPESVARAVLAQLRQPATSSEHVGVAEPQLSFERSADDNLADCNGSWSRPAEAIPSPLKTTELPSSPAHWIAPVVTEIASARTKASEQGT